MKGHHLMYLLTDDELQQLTGFKRHNAQARALRQMGIDHYVRPDGKPCVLSSTLNNLGVHERIIEPDWDA